MTLPPDLGNSSQLPAWLQIIGFLLAMGSGPVALWYDKWNSRRKAPAEAKNIDANTKNVEGAADQAQAIALKAYADAATAQASNYAAVLVQLSAQDAKIKILTDTVSILQADKFKLELENRNLNQQVTSMQSDNTKLRERVRVVEDVVKSLRKQLEGNNIIPKFDLPTD